MADRSLAPPADFRVSGVPGTELPSASLGGVPGVDVSPLGSPDAPLASTGALLSQLTDGLVTNVAGWPSQELITAPHALLPSRDTGYHKRIGRGQLLFCYRDSREKGLDTIVTLPQLNAILLHFYRMAVAAGAVRRDGGGGDDGGGASAELGRYVVSAFEEDIDRRRRELDTRRSANEARSAQIGAVLDTSSLRHMSDGELREALAENTYLNYLSVAGILSKWNYLGSVRNVENSQSEFKVLNMVKGGPIDVDNVWGPRLEVGQYLYLVLTRRHNAVTGDYEQFEFVPWAQAAPSGARNAYTKYPSAAELEFEDEAGYTQYGVYFTVGKVGRAPQQSTWNTPENARRLAGRAPVANPEASAWSAQKNKSTVFVSMGRDSWDVASL